MATFKVGDRVKRTSGGKHNSTGLPLGHEGIVSAFSGSTLHLEGYGTTGFSPDYYIIISSNVSNMTIKEKFLLSRKDEPLKTFQKAGITNPDDSLTPDGDSIFKTWLLRKFGADFKKEVVDDLLKEETK